MTDTIEGEARPLAVQEPQRAVAEWTPRFAVAVDEAIERKAEKRRFFENVMDEGLHYGVIPGTKSKPTLLKPGAEMLLSTMGLAQELSDAEPPVRDYDGSGAGHGEPLIAYRRVCRIYRQTGTHEDERMLISQAEGFCTSREEKYRYRSSSRSCPSCGGAFIIKGKAEYGGGWLCFKKKGGCGAKFDDGDPAIESQAEGKVANPNVADTENTILKMADKRALVAATLLATGCSDIFTQDVEDALPEAPEAPEPPPKPAAAKDIMIVSRGPQPPRTKAEQVEHERSRVVIGSSGRDSGSPGSHDPVEKGRALDALAALRRDRFVSPPLWSSLLVEMWPQHVSPKTGTVSEGDLSVEELRATWAECNRRTKPERAPDRGGSDHPAEGREPVVVPEASLFDSGLDDEVAL